MMTEKNDPAINVNELLESALDVEPTELADFFRHSEAPKSVIEEVKKLLKSDVETGDFLEGSAADLVNNQECSTFEDNTAHNDFVGPYRILSEIAKGGMGAVYLAVREDGDFEQKVALKLLRPELNTGVLRRRFETERDILAALEHPNIARILDAGTSDQGIPFIALEYVDGKPLTKYCDINSLGLKARLRLFLRVCDAVEYAHRHLVIHRDLKPENILVDADGNPKLLDFGISRFVVGEDHELQTVTKLGAMTPGYASPEQLRGEKVSTSSDVFSLGVVLYELLTGRRPFGGDAGDLKAIIDQVMSEDRILPSSVAANTPDKVHQEKWNSDSDLNGDGNVGVEPNTNPVGLATSPLVSVSSRELKGDIDNIILKALDPDVSRRYLSARDLASDIGRYLDGQPVLARPVTTSYRLKKFVSRNRGASFITVVLGLITLLALVGVLLQSRVANERAQAAEKRFSEVRAIANSNLFEVYPEIEKLEGSLKARELILKNALTYLDSLAAEASDDISLQRELASAYERVGELQGAPGGPSLGDLKTSNATLKKALRMRRDVLRGAPGNADYLVDVADLLKTIGRNEWSNDNTQIAIDSFNEAIDKYELVLKKRPDSGETKNKLANAYLDAGRIPAFNNEYEKALPLFEKGLKSARSLVESAPANMEYKKSLAKGLRAYSTVLRDSGKPEEALAQLEKSGKLSDEVALALPDDFRAQRIVWLNQYYVCELFINSANSERSFEACKTAIEFPEKGLAKEPENSMLLNDLLTSYFNAARGARVAKRHSDAYRYALKAATEVEKQIVMSPSDEFKRTKATYLTEAGRALEAMNREEEAIRLFTESLQILSKIVDSDKANNIRRYDLGLQQRLVGRLFSKLGDKKRAREYLEKALENAQFLKREKALSEKDKDLVEDIKSELRSTGG